VQPCRGAELAGQDPGHDIVVEPTLLTQSALRDGNIPTIEDLNAKLPAFGHSAAATCLDPGALTETHRCNRRGWRVAPVSHVWNGSVSVPQSASL